MIKILLSVFNIKIVVGTYQSGNIYHTQLLKNWNKIVALIYSIYK